MLSGSVVTIPVLFLGGVLLAMRKDTVLALIMLVFVPVVFVIVTVIGRKIEPLWVISDSYVDKPRTSARHPRYPRLQQRAARAQAHRRGHACHGR